mmetsp:Transcript_118965/g.210395  ORF Transcript_118965/g.210395 Transcript_118965/m.210395 type:complete len:96 (-) Transcript_118965:936-1223(-)
MTSVHGSAAIGVIASRVLACAILVFFRLTVPKSAAATVAAPARQARETPVSATQAGVAKIAKPSWFAWIRHALAMVLVPMESASVRSAMLEHHAN